MSDCKRLVLGVSYNGSPFEGWQTQPHGRTVQDVLQLALSRIASHPVNLTCAGRTDAGVHARRQVVHFDCFADRPLKAWVKGVNAFLPAEVSVQSALQVDTEFHARFAALSRTYRYYFYSSPSRDPLKPTMTWLHYPVDVGLMRLAATVLLGEHDFSAFRAAQCQAKSPVRTIYRIDLVEQSDYAFAEIHGNAFLHHMVRNIMGCLLEIGTGRRDPAWLAEVLASRSRENAARTYPATGLTFWDVEYPERFAIQRLFDRTIF